MVLTGVAARMADSTAMLSVCDPVHLVLTKTSPSGDTSSLVSSHFLDWRRVLAAADSRCNVGVELMGIGQYQLWFNGLVVSALGTRTRGPGFESRVAPLFNWVATLGSCLHTLPPQFLSSKKLGYKKGVFGT